MHQTKLIKICGVTTERIASIAGALGANYIGLVFHETSKRAVSLKNAIPIANAAKKAGATPVAVFVNQTYETMQNICETTKISTVQLHGAIAKRDHVRLPKHYQRIFAVSYDNAHEWPNDLDIARDFILVDTKTPGSGQCFDWSSFTYRAPFRWFLAGGLTQNNVTFAIEQLLPHGVDVSSGIESNIGFKDIALIKAFISAVRGGS